MHTRVFTIAVVIGSALGISNAANSAEIRGTVVTIGDKSKSPARYVVRGQKQKHESKTSSGVIAIALEPLGVPAKATVPDTAFVMAQENTSFVPNLLVIPVGAEVTFPNHDAFFHNVFSYSPPRSFDLGRYPQGETRTVRFDEAGIVRIFCEIHASMYATILIAPSDYYQTVNSTEAFSFPDLPAGRYRVLAVDAAGRRASSEVEISGDQTIELSLMLE